MFNTRSIIVMVSAAMVTLGVGAVSGQDFPNKPIRILSPSGGVADVTSRQIAQGISSPLGQSVVIENRVAVIAAETVAKAPPDGYTLLATSTSFWVGPLVQKASYDVVRDFLPITLAVRSPNLLVVHPALPVKSVKELIALAKAKPGALNYSAGNRGGTAHLGAELFKEMAGVNIVGIFYANGSQETADLLAGEVQLTVSNGPSVATFLKSGRLKALAVTTTKPSALFPELPTVAAAGLPGYEVELMMGIFAPAKSPASIINRLNQEIVRFLNRADAKEGFLSRGAEVVASSPEQFAATLKSDIAKWGKVIKDAGIKAD